MLLQRTAIFARRAGVFRWQPHALFVGWDVGSSRYLLIALALTSPISSFAQNDDRAPTPIYPVGPIPDESAQEFKWAPVQGAVDYQIRFHAPAFHDKLPNNRAYKGHTCADYNNHDDYDVIAFVTTPEEAKECPIKGLTQPSGTRCLVPPLASPIMTPPLKELPKPDDFAFNLLHPLRTYTGCIPGALEVVPPTKGDSTVCVFDQTSPMYDPKMRSSGDRPRGYIGWDIPSRNCAGQSRLYTWAVRAVYRTAEGGTRFGPWSNAVAFTYGPSVPTDASSAPATVAKDTPVTFVNASGVTLYLYHLYGGGSTDCKNFQFDGVVNAQGRVSFTVPARRTVQFVFQTAQDPCDLSLNHSTLAITGGNPNPQVLNVP